MASLKEIENRLQYYEATSRELELSSKARKNAIKNVVAYSENFLSDIDTRPTFKAHHADSVLSDKWNLDDKSTIEEITTLISEEMDGIGLNPASGGHLGYIPGGGIFPSALGDYIAAINNHYSTVHFAGPAAVELENYLVQWLGKVLGFSDKAVGTLTSGGSIANLQSIIVARDHHDVMDGNIADYCIYLSQQSHHSLQKAFRIAGLKNCPIRFVETDEHYRLNTNHLKQLIEEDLAQGKYPFLCIANLGTTDTGAVDPIADISAICRKHNLWLHVDAAYGGFFKLVEDELDVSIDLSTVDSITVDPHKCLFLPYGTGSCLFRDVNDLFKSFHYSASYMQDTKMESVISSADTGIELSRHFRGLRMWLPLKLLGIDRFKASLKEKLYLTRYFYHKVQKLGFEVGPYPDLSVMIYRYTDTDKNLNEFNKLLIREIHKDGDVFLSSTTLDGTFWLRLAVSNFRTHKETIDRCLAMLERCVERVEGSL